jgi:hypothetical protein
MDTLFPIHMTFQGADYTFEVLPETTPQGTRYNILRDNVIVFDLCRDGEVWIDAHSGLTSAFVRELGNAIDLQLHVLG